MTAKIEPKTIVELFDLCIEKLRSPTGGGLQFVISTLCKNTGFGRLIQPDDAEAVWATWGEITRYLSKSQFPHMAARVALALYERTSDIQEEHAKSKNNPQRIHKGDAAHLVAIRCLENKEMRRAFWYCYLAFIEDVLQNAERGISVDFPEEPATGTLRDFFSQTSEHLSEAANIARQEYQNDKNKLLVYPEIAAIHMAREQNLFAPGLDVSGDIPVNRPLMRRLLSGLELGDNAHLGQALELLASYVTFTLPAVSVRPNVRSNSFGATFEHEFDLVVTQHAKSTSMLLDGFGRHFVIECKNWRRALGVQQLNHFVAKMRFHGCKCGVIFSKNGLTGDKSGGDKGLRYAHITRLRWFHHDGCIVIIIRKDHLKQIARGLLTFEEMLLRGYEAVKFSSLKIEQEITTSIMSSGSDTI
jgi:hypothetical protein